MSLASDFLTAQGISYEWPDGTVLFSNLNLTLNNQKIALVGPNGIGKSTLAKILCGELNPAAGIVYKSKDIKYFAQLAVEINEPLENYLQNIWEQHHFDFRLAEILLQGVSLEQNFNTLSGGEQMRVRLLKTICESASLLILDEPSNNLDLASKEILLRFIQEYSHGILLISHDRLLLQQMDQILELSNQGLSVYGGNFLEYEIQKQEELQRQEKELAFLKQEKRKLRLEFEEKIRNQEKRMRSGAQAAEKGGMPKILLGARKRQAQQSLGKINSNEQKRYEKGQKELAQKIADRKIDEDFLLQLEEVDVPTRNSLVCEAKELNLCFEHTQKVLWKKAISFQIYGKDRVCFQGRNGSGKTSLLNFLTQKEGATKLQKITGELRKIQRPWCYLDQSLSVLNLYSDEKILDFIMQDSRFDQTESRNLMARYQFYALEVFKKISDLSGGERLKLGLCHLYLTRKRYEVLILDEPTNNLDLQSVQMLEQVLKAYKGALIVVSHDPVFLNHIGINKTIFLGE